MEANKTDNQNAPGNRPTIADASAATTQKTLHIAAVQQHN
jgi:hypothetical protein